MSGSLLVSTWCGNFKWSLHRLGV